MFKNVLFNGFLGIETKIKRGFYKISKELILLKVTI